jgi:hypothetical protein
MHRRSTKGKRGAESSPRIRQGQPDIPPLFCSNREKNFSLWVQNCFPDAVLAREDAIRQWLTSPLEARVQKGHNYHAESVKSNGSQAPASPSQQVRDSLGSSKTGTPNLTGEMRGNAKLLAPNDGQRFSAHFALTGRNLFISLLAICSVGALLIVIALRATPRGTWASQANKSIEANKPNNARPAKTSSVPVPPADEAIETESASGPFTIQNVSVGCEDTQPCVQIRTRGKASLPSLSTLTKPDRVVMDFPDAMLSSDIQGIKVGRGVVKDVRTARHTAQPSHTRVVIDLREKCDYQLRTVTNGVVLQVSLKATSRQNGS